MWNWLVNEGHIYSALVGAIVGVLVTLLLGGGLYRWVIVRVRLVWQAHEKTQLKIADHLDVKTAGGLGTVVKRLEEQNQKLEELKTTISQEDLDGRGQE